MGTQKKGASENPETELMGQTETDLDDPTEMDFGTGTETDLDVDVDVDDTVAMSGRTDNVGETSVEIDVNELIAELEAEGGIQPRPRDGTARKRLEEVLEERRIAHEIEDLDELDELDTADADQASPTGQSRLTET